MQVNQHSSTFRLRFHAASAQVRLFCFHHSGGNASAFHEWGRILGPHVEVCAATLPGHVGRFGEQLCTRMDQLVDVVVSAMECIPHRPFMLYGHSMGALLAFEVAHCLRRRGANLPTLLVVAGMQAPHLRSKDRALHALPDSELIMELRRMGGTPEEALGDPTLMSLLLPIMRADYQVVDTWSYLPVPRLDVPILALGGLDDTVSDKELEAWQDCTTARCRTHLFPGNHFFVQSARDQVLSVVRETMKELVG